MQNYIDEDETMLDSALSSGLFHWMPQYIMTKKTLTQEEFYFRRIHQLLTDLIVLMPLKVRRNIYFFEMKCKKSY